MVVFRLVRFEEEVNLSLLFKLDFLEYVEESDLYVEKKRSPIQFMYHPGLYCIVI